MGVAEVLVSGIDEAARRLSGGSEVRHVNALALSSDASVECSTA